MDQLQREISAKKNWFRRSRCLLLHSGIRQWAGGRCCNAWVQRRNLASNLYTAACSCTLHLNKCDTVLQLGLMNQCAFCENYQDNPDFLWSCQDYTLIVHIWLRRISLAARSSNHFSVDRLLSSKQQDMSSSNDRNRSKRGNTFLTDWVQQQKHDQMVQFYGLTAAELPRERFMNSQRSLYCWKNMRKHWCRLWWSWPRVDCCTCIKVCCACCECSNALLPCAIHETKFKCTVSFNHHNVQRTRTQSR
jgi:hypothetical protein